MAAVASSSADVIADVQMAAVAEQANAMLAAEAAVANAQLAAGVIQPQDPNPGAVAQGTPAMPAGVVPPFGDQQQAGASSGVSPQFGLLANLRPAS